MDEAARERLIDIILKIAIGAVTILLFLETVVRVIIDLPAKTDFYSSITQKEIPHYQKIFGLKANAGSTWVHLGWVADPENQKYLVYRDGRDGEKLIATCRYGSALVEQLDPDTAYSFRVRSGDGLFDHRARVRTLGPGAGPVLVPRIASPWRPLFRPRKTGNYINDHAVFRSPDGIWHVIGITAFGDGDYSKEVYFAHATSRLFPPPRGEMEEREPVADFGRLAWAPHAIQEDLLYLWFSPHRAYCALSENGYTWRESGAHSFLPYHPQFRDPMVLRVAEGQWLMYATARDGYYSTVDVYQSFDLRHWQYIGAALTTAFGAERAGATASTESPFVLQTNGRYYLSFTYNNGSFFWHPLLLSMKIWLDRDSYNETLVFQSENPYNFGVYRGRTAPSSLVTILEAHAPEYVFANGRWYITTAGWPWVASLTAGEVAAAEIEWRKSE